MNINNQQLISSIYSTFYNKNKNKNKFIPSRTNKQWCKNNNKIKLWNTIIKITSFLPNDSPFRQRFYHIKNNFFSYHICPYCNNNIYKFNINKYLITCNNKQCRRLYKSIMNTGINNPSYNKKQSKSTKLKRYNSRKNNNKEWHTIETKKKISLSNKKTHNDINFKIKDKQNRILNNTYKKQSNSLKKRILNGYTPCITNSWANSRCKINVNGFKKLYRSSWDAVFQILNPNCQYEKIRIKYISPKDNKYHIYIIDFVDEQNKILYEVKPRCNINNKINKAKEKYTKQWCINNDYKFKYISNEWFKINAKYINYNKYDEKYIKE